MRINNSRIQLRWLIYLWYGNAAIRSAENICNEHLERLFHSVQSTLKTGDQVDADAAPATTVVEMKEEAKVQAFYFLSCVHSTGYCFALR